MSEEERQQYKRLLEVTVSNPQCLIYIDETHRGRNDARRRRHWSKRGVTPLRRELFEGYEGTRYSLLAACDIDGFVKEACDIVERERSDDDTDPSRGTVDRARFDLWVEKMLVPILGKASLSARRSIVVMDNASIHRGGRAEALIKAAGAEVIYLPAYSPDLNPIELMFGVYKAKLRRLPGRSMTVAHSLALAAVTPRIARAFFRKAGVPGCAGFASIEDLKNEANDIAVTAAALTATVVVQAAACLAACKSTKVI